LLEIEPEKQTTYIDMLSTSVELGIPVVCVTEVIKKGKQLFYLNKNGDEVRIEKIYNRVVFDELEHRPDLKMSFRFTDDLEVKWVGHPNWFYRISKYVMPLLKSRYVPETHYLHTIIDKLPEDLHNWVLKPLFSFAGAGVIIDVDKEVIEGIQNPSQYILQRKVQYEPVIESPTDPVKVEVRMLMLWPEKAESPFVVTNLARLSKGKMIGVKYNKDKDWVGGSVGLFF
jgi:glutathionylspermidine synthase